MLARKSRSKFKKKLGGARVHVTQRIKKWTANKIKFGAVDRRASGILERSSGGALLAHTIERADKTIGGGKSSVRTGTEASGPSHTRTRSSRGNLPAQSGKLGHDRGGPTGAHGTWTENHAEKDEACRENRKELDTREEHKSKRPSGRWI
jgi:hypothetical protein